MEFRNSSGSNTMVLEHNPSSKITRTKCVKKSKSSSIDEVAKSIAQTAISTRKNVKAKAKVRANPKAKAKAKANTVKTKQTVIVHMSTSKEEKENARNRYKNAIKNKFMMISDLPIEKAPKTIKTFTIKKVVASVDGIKNADFWDDEYIVNGGIRENIIQLKNGQINGIGNVRKKAYSAIKDLQNKLNYDIFHTKKVKKSNKYLIRVRNNPNNDKNSSNDIDYVDRESSCAYLVISNIGIIWVWSDDATKMDKNKKAVSKFNIIVNKENVPVTRQILTIDNTHNSNSTEEKQYQKYDKAVENKFMTFNDIPTKNKVITSIYKIIAKVSGITGIYKVNVKRNIIEQSVILKSPGKINTLQKKLDNIIIQQIPGGRGKRFVINVRSTKTATLSNPFESNAYLVYSNDGVVWIWESAALKLSTNLVNKFNKNNGYIFPKPITRGYRLNNNDDQVIPSCLISGSHNCIDKVCYRRLLESINLNKSKWTKPLLIKAILHYNENKRLNVNNRLDTLSIVRLMGIIRNLKTCK